jgi:transcriptional regulator with XRE-family HTH domain
MTLAESIATIRAARHAEELAAGIVTGGRYTMRACAERAGWGETTAARNRWYLYEAGRVANPSLAVLGKLSRGLNVSLSRLLRGVDEIPEK